MSLVTWTHQARRVALWAVLLSAAGLILLACSGGSITNSIPSLGLGRWGSSLFPDSPERTALAAAPDLPSMDEDCPTVDIRRGAGTLSVAAQTREQATASDVRYQLSFHQFARQCALDGKTIRMRVGVQGRVIVGPAGAPSQVDVPLRYAVVREGVEPKTVVTKFRRLPISMPSGSTNVPFTDIEEDLSFPLPSRAELEAYVVYVGFDEESGRKERRPPAKKSSPRPR